MQPKTRRRTASIFAWVALATPLAIRDATASASYAPTFNCSAPFDSYKVTAATRQACGIETWPLSQVAAVPGGGKDYIYFVSGHKTIYRIPPDGFDFVNASDAQLTYYGLPTRPLESTQLAGWTDMMSRIHLVTPPNFLVSLPASADYSSAWSGYETTGGGYWWAWSYWNEVSIGPSCSGSTELTWAGLGGDRSTGSSFLGQAGTEVGVGGAPDHSAWYQVLPDLGRIQQISGVFGHPGYGFVSSVQWNATYSYYTFYVYDSYSGSSSTLAYYTNSWDGKTADYIMERGQSGSVTPLSNYYYVNFVEDEANGRGSGHYINQYANKSVTMTSDGTSGGRILSYISQSVSGSGAFQIHYKDCS